MALVLAATLGAVATAVIGSLMFAPSEVRQNNRRVAQRDENLEEWIVVHHRELLQRFSELTQQATEAGVSKGGTLPAGRAAVQTTLLYEYREELQRARDFVLELEAGERWTLRLARWVQRKRFPSLETPRRAERLIDYWSEGTARNALTWSLDDILNDLPVRATSRAVDPDAPRF
jgi:hypothetical protein